MEARVLLRATCEICGEQNVNWTGLYPSTWVFYCQYHSTNAPCSSAAYCLLRLSEECIDEPRHPSQKAFYFGYMGTHDSVRRELRTECILDKSDEYRRSWLLHLQRMPPNRIPLKSYHYKPQGRRTIGRPKKRWREQL